MIVQGNCPLQPQINPVSISLFQNLGGALEGEACGVNATHAPSRAALSENRFHYPALARSHARHIHWCLAFKLCDLGFHAAVSLTLPPPSLDYWL